MLNYDISEIVSHGAKSLGIALPHTAAAAFTSYYEFLEKQGKDVNLTAITGAEDVARFHFLDSIALLNAAQFKDARIVDIGSGAGFPGVALKVAEPSIDLTLLDATGKRVTFLSGLCSLLGIDAKCIHARAEDAAQTPDLRERFDIAASRAVARLNVLCELCLPFVRVGGTFIAMKAASSDDEIAEANRAAEALGAEMRGCHDYVIPGTDVVHRAVLIQKISTTPEVYPRRFSRIKKAPL